MPDEKGIPIKAKRGGAHQKKATRDEKAAILAHRRKQVAQLWLRGKLTPQEIAEQLGVSIAVVKRDRLAIRQEWTEHYTGSFQDHVVEEWRGLDELQRRAHAWLQGVESEKLDPETKAKIRCAYLDRILRLSESRRKLLGTDRPQTFEILHRVDVNATRGVLTDLDGLGPAYIPGPGDRDGFEPPLIEVQLTIDDEPDDSQSEMAED